jgi:hypothetical protein
MFDSPYVWRHKKFGLVDPRLSEVIDENRALREQTEGILSRAWIALTILAVIGMTGTAVGIWIGLSVSGNH